MSDSFVSTHRAQRFGVYVVACESVTSPAGERKKKKGKAGEIKKLALLFRSFLARNRYLFNVLLATALGSHDYILPTNH